MTIHSGNATVSGKGTGTGFIKVSNESGGAGTLYQGSNSTTWSTVSDRRLKKNITGSTVGLAELNQLQIRNFEYRSPEEISELPAHQAVDVDGTQVGVIAQEIQQVFPSCVKEESTGVLRVDSDAITWHLVKAVQELSAKNDELEARLAALESA